MPTAVELIMALAAIALTLTAVTVGVSAYWICAACARLALRALRRARERTALRGMEHGTCDGLNARQIRHVVDSAWSIDEQSHHD